MSDRDDFEMFTPEDVADEPEETEEFDGDKFEEEYRRKLEEKHEQEKTLKLKIIFIISATVLMAILILMFCYTDWGIIGTYKKNFQNNFNKLFAVEQAIDIGATEKNNNVQEYVEDENAAKIKNVENTSEHIKIVPFEGAATGKFDSYRNGLICTRTNYICYINDMGQIEWEQNTTVVDPLLSVDGSYIAIAAENGTRLCLYKGKELMFEADTDEEIKSIRASAGGDVVLVCDKENYKGEISVYNKDGQEIFAWASGKNNILNADISSASRRVAATLINTDRKVYSLIKVFDINSKTHNVEMVFDDTILFKVDYTGDTISGFGDNSIVCMTSTGRVISDKRFDMVDINHYAFDINGNKLIHFDSAGIPVFHLYGRKGILKSEMIVDYAADCIDVEDEFVLYNNGRSIMLRRMGSDRINSYTATMDVLKLILINHTTYGIIHSNSIEIVKI